MAASNGSAKGPKMNGVNGSVKGANGSAKKAPINGHAIAARRKAVPRGRSVFAKAFSIAARLLTWYSIFTLLFRCPASLEACDENTPPICKPYFQLKQAVAPQLKPYYDAYAAPYVDLARPYYDVLDRNVVTPSQQYAVKYGAPRVAHAKLFTKAQWEQNIQPQLLKYQTLARAQYEQSMGPHVDRLSGSMAPYYDIAKTNVLQSYHEVVLPSYELILPYAQKSLHATSDFTTNTAIPSALWVWEKAYLFLDGTVWPQLRVTYAETVEPQLVRIGKRLGRHNGPASTTKPVLEELSSSASHIASSFARPAQSVFSSVSSSISQAASTLVATETSSTDGADNVSLPVTETPILGSEHVQAPEIEPEEEESELRRVTREAVAEGLKEWQERYAKAADEGAAEIDDRVDEISKRMIRRGARVEGKALLQQLQASVESELVTLRRDILQVSGAVAKGESSIDDGQEEIITVVRRAGMGIKDAAKKVRAWRENYEQELHASVTEAAAKHFSILDSIRDLALQKLGMKWAWMDGISYKDWEKYHELKERFDEWHDDLKQLIVTHPGLEAAILEGAKIEEDAMDTAQAAAKELQRLKQDALLRIGAKERSDSPMMQDAAKAAESAASIVKDKVGSATNAASDAAHQAAAIAAESLEDVSSAAKSVVESISDKVSSFATEKTQPTIDSVVSQGTEMLSSATDAAASKAGEASSSASSVLASNDAASSKDSQSTAEGAHDLASDASTFILAETPIMAGNTAEIKEDEASPVELPIEDVLDDPTARESTQSSASSMPSIKSAMFGAAAQSVPKREPILDDDSDEEAASIASSIRNDLPASFSRKAQSAFSAAVAGVDSKYSQALSLISAQMSGTPQPAHEKLLASVTSAYSLAMSSASARLTEAMMEASKRLGGTPTTNNIIPTAINLPSMPTVDWASIEAVASERLNQGRAWAEEQYASAKIAIGLATPTPSTPAEHAERLLENAKYNYYAGVGAAYARYSEFMAAASSAVSSMTAAPTPTDLAGSASSMASVASASISSVASVAGNNAAGAASQATASAASAASVVGESASSLAAAASGAAAAGYDTVASAAGAGYDSAASAASAGYDSAASAASAGYDTVASAGAQAGDAIADTWDAVVSQLSVQIYGAPTPTFWYDGIYSGAGEYAASATDAAAGGAAAVTSAAGTYAAAASEEAARQYSAVSSLVSELLIGKEPTFTESVYSRLGVAYQGGFASASSLASVAQASAASVAGDASSAAMSAADKVASMASEATDVVKESAQRLKDEL